MASAVLGHINRALALTLGSAFAFLLVHYVSVMMSDSIFVCVCGDACACGGAGDAHGLLCLLLFEHVNAGLPCCVEQERERES
jgi:hypothetical protein